MSESYGGTSWGTQLSQCHCMDCDGSLSEGTRRGGGGTRFLGLGRLSGLFQFARLLRLSGGLRAKLAPTNISSLSLDSHRLNLPLDD